MLLTARHPDRPGFRPLYQQVRELLLSRIASGAWQPAEALPSEHALAAELGVSQGTVRKALDSLAADNLIERRQGKGTYVAQHTPESAQFRFFRLNFDSNNARALPKCKNSTISRRRPDEQERAALDLEAKDDVFCINRTRYIKEEAILFDEICVPAKAMTNLDAHHPLPNTLYTFYQEIYGASIIGATEQIKAVLSDEIIARELGIKAGEPLLMIERCAFGLNDQPLEFRRTFYRTENYHYAVELS